MNTNKELERIVSDWLDDRAVAPPHGSLDSALARAGRTPQQYRWLRRLFGRRSGATRSADRGDTSDSKDRRNRLMFSATAVAASMAALALAASLVAPLGTGQPDPVPAAGGGTTYSVAADGSGDYLTINGALAAAEDGDTILVAPGTYTEYLVIDKDITLAGDGPRDEIVIEFPEGAPAYLVDEDEDEGVVETPFPLVLQGSDTILRGFTIVVPLGGGGVYVERGAPELTELSVVPHPGVEIWGSYRDALTTRPFVFAEGSSPVIRDSAWTGFLYGGGSSPTFEANTATKSVMALDGPGEAVIRGNTFLEGVVMHLDFDLTGVIEGNDLSGGLIGIGAGSSMIVRDNVVHDVKDFRDAAIAVGEPGSSAEIVGNTVFDSTVGIRVAQGARATIKGNDLSGNDTAIHWSSKETGAVDANTVRGGKSGISITGGNPSVVDNTVEGASSFGLFVGARTQPTLEGNTVCGCETNLVIAESAEPVVGENEICPDGVAMAE